MPLGQQAVPSQLQTTHFCAQRSVATRETDNVTLYKPVCTHSHIKILYMSIYMYTTVQHLSITLHTTVQDLSITLYTTVQNLSITLYTTVQDLSITLYTTVQDLSITLYTIVQDLSITLYTYVRTVQPLSIQQCNHPFIALEYSTAQRYLHTPPTCRPWCGSCAGGRPCSECSPVDHRAGCGRWMSSQTPG